MTLANQETREIEGSSAGSSGGERERSQLESILATARFHTVGGKKIRPFERSTTVLVLFFLMFSLPPDWFRLTFDRATGDRGTAGDTGLYAVVLVLLIGGLVFQFASVPNAFMRSLLQEPLIPIFLGLAAVSSLWSEVPSVSARRSFGLMMATAFAIYLSSRYSMRQLLGLVTVTIAIGTAMCLLWGVLLPQYGFARGSSTAFVGLHFNKNIMGETATLGFMTALLAARTFRRHRFALYLLALTNIGFVVASTSKSALVALLLLPAMLIVYQAFRARRTLYGAVIITMIAAAVTGVAIITVQIEAIAEFLGKDPSLSGRIPLWRALLTEITQRPLLGAGWNGFFRGYFSPAHEVWVEFPWQPPHSHNTFIDIAVDLGLIGGALYLAIFLRAASEGTKTVRETSSAIGMWLLAHASFVLLFSVTESQKPSYNVQWVLLVALIIMVRAARRGGDRSDTRTFDDEQVLLSGRAV